MTSHDDLSRRSLRLLPYYRRRIWWITSRVFALTVVFTAVGLAVAPKYVARTKFSLLPTRGELGSSLRSEIGGLSPAVFLGQTHAEVLGSRSLAEDVAKTLQAQDAAELANGGVLGAVRRNVVGPIRGVVGRVVTLLNTGRWATPDPFMGLVYAIQGRTQVQNLPGSFVYQVSVTWEKPALAARIANLITERYVQLTLRTNQEEMRRTREFIDARVTEIAGELKTLEKAIQDYRSGSNFYSSSDLDLGLQELSQYLRDLNATRVSWEQLDARINALKPYQTQAALAAIEAERTGLKSRQEAVEKVIGEQIVKLDALPAKQSGLLDLYRDRMTKERALTALQDRLLETKVSEAAQLSAVRIIDSAIPPVYPERPLLLRNAATSLLVGLLLSAGLVLLSEARHAGLRCREDLAQGGASMLALVPFVEGGLQDDPRDGKSGRLMEFCRRLARGPYSSVAHRRTTRRHLEHLLVRLTNGPKTKVCLLASLNGGEGKTFLIVQLARLAEEAGRKVLLVDANLAQPALQAALGLSQAPGRGMAELLAGQTAIHETLVAVNASTDLIGAGVARLNTQARWAVDAVAREVAGLAPQYDLVLIDTGALRRDPSAVRLLPLATEVLCVFDATTSRQGDQEDTRQRLAEAAGPAECILNKVMHEGDYLFTAGSNGVPSIASRTTAAHRTGA